MAGGRRAPDRASEEPWRPTAEQLAAAAGKSTVPDVIAPGLRVLFCGINPGLYSGAVGHHFARPGNRFWPALHRSGFTPRVLSPFEERRLLDYGLGVTNLVRHATRAADELEREELRKGAGRLRRLVERFRPRWVAILGFGAFRAAFDRTGAAAGPQPEPIGSTRVWLLPNPSGLNASFTPERIVDEFRKLRLASG
jgi:TDG/mug DNA glycosylase family protein